MVAVFKIVGPALSKRTCACWSLKWWHACPWDFEAEAKCRTLSHDHGGMNSPTGRCSFTPAWAGRWANPTMCASVLLAYKTFLLNVSWFMFESRNTFVDYK